MNDWEEITFDKVDGIGWFKFTYLVDGILNEHTLWVECIENEEDDDTFVQELLMNLKTDKRVCQLKAYKSIAEYE